MARKNNMRNLRRALWSNPMFCMYCAKSQAVSYWANSLRTMGKLHDLPRKLMLRTKKKKKSV